MRTLNVFMLSGVAMSLLMAAPVQAVENVRGKQIQLTAQHGPWMVMVTSFRNVRDQDMKKDGLTAEEAAAELVFELREMNIPAYAYSQDAVKGQIDTRNRLGRDDHRIYAAQRDMICVLAGNYSSIDDKVGQKTLKFIKAFRPKFLNSKSGAILRSDAAVLGPLAGAFMTINPMIKPEDVAQRTIDKEVKHLNDGIRYPLITNPHKYTVRVATFAGKSSTTPLSSAFSGREGKFDENVKNPLGYNIIRAGEDAEQLAAFLHKDKPNGLNDAWVYHDKFQSIVTIGGFDSPDDPRIRMIVQYYGPQLVPDMRFANAVRRADPTQDATPEEVDKLPKILTTRTEQLLPRGATRDTQPTQVWTFDTAPQVIQIPRIK